MYLEAKKLTDDQLIDQTEKLYNGDKTVIDRLFFHYVSASQSFARKYCLRTSNKSLHNDIFSAGYEGLLIGLDKILKKKIKIMKPIMSNFLYGKIRWAIQNFLEENRSVISVPHHIKKMPIRIVRIRCNPFVQKSHYKWLGDESIKAKIFKQSRFEYTTINCLSLQIKDICENNGLTEEEKKILQLRVQDYRLSEIANILKVSVGTVNNRLNTLRDDISRSEI